MQQNLGVVHISDGGNTSDNMPMSRCGGIQVIKCGGAIFRFSDFPNFRGSEGRNRIFEISNFRNFEQACRERRCLLGWGEEGGEEAEEGGEGGDTAGGVGVEGGGVGGGVAAD